MDFADGIWTTCCALCNMLLDDDGLTEDWTGVDGQFDYDEASKSLPFSLQRLNDPSLRRIYVTSGMGCAST